MLAVVLCAAPLAAHAQAPLGPVKTDGPVSLEQGAGFVLVDLTKKDDATSPVVRFGYQTFVGDAVRRRRERHPDDDVHGVPYLSVSVAGTPAGDIANLFGDGRLASGADVQLSYGQAYVFSFAAPFNVSVGRADIRSLASKATDVETERSTAAPNQATLNKLADDVALIRGNVETIRHGVKVQSHRRLYDAIVAYANAIEAYARAPITGPNAPNPHAKPEAPNAKQVLELHSGPIYDAWFIRGGVNAGSATLFDPTKPFADQFHDESFTGYSAQVGYSVRMGGALPYILAFSGGVRRGNNLGALHSIDVTETQSFTSADGATKRGTSSKQSGFVGELHDETNASGKADLVLYPWLAAASRDATKLRSTIAFDLFARAERGSRTVLGGGAYLTKPGSPTSVYGGVNAYRATSKKLAIDLVAGFPF